MTVNDSGHVNRNPDICPGHSMSLAASGGGGHGDKSTVESFIHRGTNFPCPPQTHTLVVILCATVRSVD